MKLDTSCDVVVFCSSSGHCQLDCDYCIIHPVIKRKPSIDYEDLKFFLDEIGKSTFLIFSGVGDFFAGYPKRDRFLEKLLDHDVEVALDINGVLLQEYAELTEERLAKIRFINLTMHYRQIKDKRVQKVWTENAKTIIQRHRGELLLGTILSPLVSDLWEESLLFFEENVFAPTGQKIWMIEDCDRPYTPEEATLYARLKERFAPMIAKTFRQDFAAAFAGRETVLCPAGRDYFRIWNDGRVQGCPYIGELADCGNVKERRLARRDSFFRCSTPRFCDCYDLESLGKMKVDDSPGPDLGAGGAVLLPSLASS